QLLGRAADARADQFAFAVTLYEALVGRRPFAGRTFDELRATVLGGRVDDALRKKSIPSALRRAVLRGLSVDPEKRHESMDRVASALDAHSRRTRSRWLLGGGAMAAVAAVAVVRFLGGGSHVDPCAKVADGAAAVWNEPARAQTRASFLGTGLPFGEDVWR